MDRKTVGAFFLIALILMAMPYYYEFIGLAPPPPPEQSQDQQERQLAPTPQLKEPAAAYDVSPSSDVVEELSVSDAEEVVLYLDSPLYTAGVSSRGGGSLVSFLLKQYPFNDSGAVNLIVPEMNGNNLLLAFRGISGEPVVLDQPWSLSGYYSDGDTIRLDDNLSLRFSSSLGDRTINKSLTFYPDNYTITVNADLQSISSDVVSQDRFTLIWNGGIPSTEPNKSDEASFFSANLSQGQEVTKHGGKSGNTVSSTGRTDWAAVRSKYFTAAIVPLSNSNYGEISAEENVSPDLNGNGKAPLYDMAVGFSSSAPAQAVVYVGPLQYDELKALGVGLENTMSLGIAPIRFISRAVLFSLVGLHEIIPNYGIVLIIFSVIVKLLVYPLTKKSYQSMKEMQVLQPEVMGLRDKYKSDPQKLNQATMKLYKERGVNPLGGCLPMLLQMPLLFALFIVFRSTIELRGAPFVLWIGDLSQPDALIPLPFSIPLYGDQISLLPLLMGISMFVQQKMTTSQANPQQKMMTQFMSVFFIILFNQFPSGLNLYYTLFNVLTIIQQKYFVHPKESHVVAPI